MNYPMIRRGSTGEPVTVLQRALSTYGSYKGNIDAIFGPLTDAAVRAFQSTQDLNPDGIVGPLTWGRLEELGLVTDSVYEPGVVHARFRADVMPSVEVDGSGRARLSSANIDLSPINAILDQLGVADVFPAFDASAEQVSAMEALAQQQGIAIPSLRDFIAFRFPADANVESIAEALQQLEWVELASPSRRITLAQPNDPRLGASDQLPQPIPPQPEQWYVFRCRADRAWSMATGQNVRIIVIDSGFLLDHEDLQPHVDLANALDVPSGTSTIPKPISDHATGVCGFAGAVGNNGRGIAGFAYDSTIVPIQYTDIFSGNPINVARGILHALFIPGPGRKVINLSLSAGDIIIEGEPIVRYMIDMATRLAGVVVCCSAANVDRDTGTFTTGAPIPDGGAIVVSSTSYDPLGNTHRPGTGWGTRIDVCAPGDGATDITCHARGPDQYQTFGGTSGATPKVAGTAALMLSANPLITPFEVREIIRQTGPATVPQPGKPIGRFLDTEAAVHEALHRFLITQSGQSGWRWCNICQGLFFGGGGVTVCPGGGQHNWTGSGNYVLVMNSGQSFGQSNWRWCSRCQGLFFSGAGGGCPAGGVHDGTGSGDYSLSHNGPASFSQGNWRWCQHCQGLFFGANASVSRCPVGGGSHDGTAGGEYLLKQI